MVFIDYLNKWNDNVATNGGGAISLQGQIKSIDMNSSVFISNAASTGGAVASTTPATMVLTNLTFIMNNAVTGAGLYVMSASQLLITACTFKGNSATTGGGAHVSVRSTTTSKRNIGDTVVLDGAQFSDNKATNGGGLFIFTNSINPSDSTAIVKRSKFVKNTATEQGGGVLSSAGVTLDDITFDENTAGQGSALAVSSTTGSGSPYNNINRHIPLTFFDRCDFGNKSEFKRSDSVYNW